LPIASDASTAGDESPIQLIADTPWVDRAAEFGAESIMATPIGQFRGDVTASDRHTLEAMEQQYRSR